MTKVCRVHGAVPTAEQQTTFLDDELVRHGDGRCGSSACGVCYDRSQLPAHYTRADVEAYLRYCIAEEQYYMSDPDCTCPPSDLALALQNS